MGNLIHRGKGSFTHVENTVFFDRTLSAKAKGVYCQIRSLESNPEWTFTVTGFATLFKDGIDSIKSSLKELEGHGFLIRARMRDKSGRFASADEALWITLDDPDIYEDEVAQLRQEGFTIVSKREGKLAPKPEEGMRSGECSDEDANSSQVGTTCGFSTCGTSASGSATYGDAICGESEAINPLGNLPSIESNSPSLTLPQIPRKQRGKRSMKRTDEFPPEFLELCDLSLKAVSALPFKRDCLTHWKMRVQQGYSPQQILDAYRAYRDEYLDRNGDNMALAKNLARWLSTDEGLKAYAGDPAVCRLTMPDGSPLPKQKLAAVHERYGRPYRQMMTRRSLIRSVLVANDPNANEDSIQEAFRTDETLNELAVRCDIIYDEYLQAIDPDNTYGQRTFTSPEIGSGLMRSLKRKECIRSLARIDPDFAALVERYDMLSRDTNALRLSGHIDDKTWEEKQHEIRELIHKIDSKLEEAAE